jgi:tRNA-splicing ligase RtcB
VQTLEQNGHVRVKAWIDNVEFEDAAREQILNVASLPFIMKHVAVMPDVHSGKGSTIGTVFITQKAIIPASVGVDIGCGVIAVKTTLKAEDLPDDLKPLRNRIEAMIPHGRTDEGGPNDEGTWPDMEQPGIVGSYYCAKLLDGYNDILRDHPHIAHPKVAQQLATLGTGNHFAEVCLDKDGFVWLMLHSGSRGIGARIGQYFISLARKDMELYLINLPDKDLAYLPRGTKHFDDYLRAMKWAQNYAKINRDLMMQAMIAALRAEIEKPFEILDEAINCHHNYVSFERHFGKEVMVTRKGAVNAETGRLGIIPGSMGTASYIVRGKGNRESFNSCSHGAGRRMGRNQAEKHFTLEDHEKATQGVECKKDFSVLDETPGAYKDGGAVMAAQADLVEVVAEIKQIVCVKG